MKKDSLVLFLAASVVSVGIAMTVRALLMPSPQPVESAPPPVVKVTKEKILVASRPLNAGEIIDGSMLHWKDVDHSSVTPFQMKYSDDGVRKLYGAALRKSVIEGAAFMSDFIVRPGEPGFLAAVLHPGMRAVSIPTSAVESSSGLISAGDHVDVILGLDAVAGDVQMGDVRVPYLKAQTIVTNVRVLALNNNAASLASIEPSDKKHDKRRQVIAFSTVTLEVTQEMAERLAIAKELGSLLLTLRGTSEYDRALEASTRVTSISQVTDVFQKNKKEAPTVISYKGRDLERITLTNP